MCGGSGGGGRPGRSGGGGGGGQPKEVWSGNGNGQPRPGDNAFTAALRKEYETNPNIRVSVEQGRGGTHAILTHAMGKAVISDHGIRVTGNNGRPYSYSENNILKGMQHWESLGGPKTIWKQ